VIHYTLLRKEEVGANTNLYSHLQALHRVVIACIDEAVETLGQRSPQEIRYGQEVGECAHLAVFRIWLRCELADPGYAQEVVERIAEKIQRCGQFVPLRERVIGDFSVELILPDGSVFEAQFE
jgi:hypothetical protein